MATCIAILAITPASIWGLGILLSISLSWAAMVDIDRQVLPDTITIGLTIVGVAAAFFQGSDVGLDRLIGAVVGYGSLALAKVAYSQIRGRDGLGLGDAKLFAAAGAWLGWAALPNTMVIASLVALAFIGITSIGGGKALHHDQRLAFGPYLALAMWVMWIIQMRSTPA